jgi:hypothetical protein
MQGQKLKASDREEIIKRKRRGATKFGSLVDFAAGKKKRTSKSVNVQT